MGVSVAHRADSAASNLLDTYPMLADTLRRVATAARAWHVRYSSGETIEETVNPLLQTCDTRRALSVPVCDSRLARSMCGAESLQLVLDLR